MNLYFSDRKYLEKAINTKYGENDSSNTKEDAFLLLIKGIEPENLDNLTLLMQAYYKYTGKDLSEEECYGLTQGIENENVALTKKTKNLIYQLAYFCIERGKPLGTNTIMEGKINTSDWISHSLFEGKLAGHIASRMGLNVEMATKLGILHDYGRKFVHNTGHIIKGYEALVDEGWEQEAIACLTHSFLGGGRSAWNDEPEEGFYMLENGCPYKRQNAMNDDIKQFLDKYKFTKYDLILNISDLMATSYGIVAPAERIADIATRRNNIDEMPNRGYFLAEFRNKLLEIMQDMGYEVPKEKKYELRATKEMTLQKIKEEFEDASELFYSAYQRSLQDDEIGEKIRERIKYYDEDEKENERG